MTLAACAVRVPEHTDDARDLLTASLPPERSPYAIRLSGTAATPDPWLTPPWGGGTSSAML
jgi:hypothetical protein